MGYCNTVQNMMLLRKYIGLLCHCVKKAKALLQVEEAEDERSKN